MRLNKAHVDGILNDLMHSIRGDLEEFALPFLLRNLQTCCAAKMLLSVEGCDTTIDGAAADRCSDDLIMEVMMHKLLSVITRTYRSRKQSFNAVGLCFLLNINDFRGLKAILKQSSLPSENRIY